LNHHLHDVAAIRRRVARLELLLGLLVAVLAVHMLVKLAAEVF
jgi:hypothetical protein